MTNIFVAIYKITTETASICADLAERTADIAAEAMTAIPGITLQGAADFADGVSGVASALATNTESFAGFVFNVAGDLMTFGQGDDIGQITDIGTAINTIIKNYVAWRDSFVGTVSDFVGIINSIDLESEYPLPYPETRADTNAVKTNYGGSHLKPGRTGCPGLVFPGTVEYAGVNDHYIQAIVCVGRRLTTWQNRTTIYNASGENLIEDYLAYSEDIAWSFTPTTSIYAKRLLDNLPENAAGVHLQFVNFNPSFRGELGYNSIYDHRSWCSLMSELKTCNGALGEHCCYVGGYSEFIVGGEDIDYVTLPPSAFPIYSYRDNFQLAFDLRLVTGYLFTEGTDTETAGVPSSIHIPAFLGGLFGGMSLMQTTQAVMNLLMLGEDTGKKDGYHGRH